MKKYVSLQQVFTCVLRINEEVTKQKIKHVRRMKMKTKPKKKKRQQKRHVQGEKFLPLQGHINPMLDLANILHYKGFSITLIHTNFNSPNPSNYPHFTFHSIQDGLPATEASKNDFASQHQVRGAPSRIVLEGWYPMMFLRSLSLA